MMLKVLDVDGAVRRVAGGWTATGQDWALRRRPLRPGGRGAGPRAAGHARLPRHDRLPDGVPAPRARRPGRRAVRALRQLHRAALAAERAEAAARRPRATGCCAPASSSSPRKMWPTGMRELGVDVPGKIGPDAGGRARPGARQADRPGLGSHGCARCSAGDARTTPAVPDLSRGRAWSRCWPPGTGTSGQPASSALPSRTRPQLIESLAQRIAEIGRMPYLGSLAYAVEPPARPRPQHNSAQRLRAVWHSAHRARAVARPAGRRGRPGAAGRRPDRNRLDHDGRGPAAARGRGPRRAAAGARGDHWLTGSVSRGPPGRTGGPRGR